MRKLLENETFHIATFKVQGSVHFTKTEQQFDNAGYTSKLFLLLQEYLGFSYKIVSYKLEERDKLIKENNANFTLPVLQSFERFKIMQFSHPFSIEEIKFVVGKPGELSKMAAIIRPFFIQVWIAILISYLISTILFTITFRMDGKLNVRKHVKMSEIAWALFGSFTNQGSALFSPRNQSSQLLVSGWILAIFVITSCYSGALMSFITFPGREFVPRTFSELINSINNRDYVVSLSFKTPVMKYFSKRVEDQGLNLTKWLNLNKLENSFINRQILLRVKKEKLAHIWFRTSIEINTSLMGSYSFLLSKDQLTSVNIAFGMSKQFGYKKQVNKGLLRLLEAGFLLKFINDEKFKAEKSHHTIIEENTVQHVLNMTDLAGPLLILIIGYTLSATVLFIEKIIYKIH